MGVTEGYVSAINVKCLLFLFELAAPILANRIADRSAILRRNMQSSFQLSLWSSELREDFGSRVMARG